jgi:predicted transcriptional regulator
MRQIDVAQLLGITQTAVSKYVGNVRGQALKIDQEEEIQSMMNKIASRIADRETSGPQLTLEFCSVCRAVRRNGQMCELCKRSDPEIRRTSCNACMST